MSDIVAVPIIIVGGGGCGLAMSAFLADYGIDHFLFERHPGTSVLPKAHYLNQRTMETFRLHGMIDEVRAASAPLRNMSQIAWMTSLGGNGPLDGKIIHKYGCFGGDDGSTRSQVYVHDAPLRSANIFQSRMEPIFRKYATEKNPGRVMFGHNVVDFLDEGESVLVTVRGPDGKETRYRCQYLVGCDGGKTVGSKIGINMEGRTGITDMVSVHFGADLSKYWDDRFFASHLINGSCDTIFASGAIVPMGPTWGKHSEEWVFHFGFNLDDEDRFQEEKLLPRMRDLLKIPDLKTKVYQISHWIIEAVMADKYRVGRVFVVGDSAHRRPPTTGMGLNTGIEDSLNLAWKLALVVEGKAGGTILDTYEIERRVVGKRNCRWGIFTFENSVVVNAALGLVPGKTEQNQRKFEDLFEDSEMGRTLRAQVQYMIESQKIEFSAHDIELGFTYPEGCIVSDGTEAPISDPLGQIYVPCTRPGHRLPHAWIEEGDKVLSTHDFVGGNVAFALITDEEGAEWVSAARAAAKAVGVKMVTAQIGPTPYLRDYDDTWQKVKGYGPGGAILVRPDNFVAWKSRGRSHRNGQEVTDALETLLGSLKTTAQNGILH